MLPTRDRTALVRWRILALQKACEAQPCTIETRDIVSSLIWAFLKPAVVAYEAAATTVAGGTSPGNGPDQLWRPSGLALARDGALLVVDTYNNRVQCFPPGSRLGITVAGGHGPGDAANQLKHPMDVAVCHGGGLLVADTLNHRVQRFMPESMEGLTEIDREGPSSGPDQLCSPAALVVAPDGATFVADAELGRIQRFTSGGEVATAAGCRGPGAGALRCPCGGEDATAAGCRGPRAGALRCPCGLALGPDGALYVADAGNHRVVRCPGSAAAGVVVGGRGPGETAGQLRQPAGVAVCADGTLLVSDTLNNRVQRFAPGSMDGVTVAGRGGSGGSAADQLFYPAGLVVAPDESILVADSYNHRVQRFAPLFA